MDYLDYEFNYIDIDCKDQGDVKAIAHIDAYPMNDYGEQIAEGYTAAQVVLSEHNDIIVVWCSNEGRLNSKVLELIEHAKVRLITEYIGE